MSKVFKTLGSCSFYFSQELTFDLVHTDTHKHGEDLGLSLMAPKRSYCSGYEHWAILNDFSKFIFGCPQSNHLNNSVRQHLVSFK